MCGGEGSAGGRATYPVALLDTLKVTVVPRTSHWRQKRSPVERGAVIFSSCVKWRTESGDRTPRSSARERSCEQCTYESNPSDAVQQAQRKGTRQARGEGPVFFLRSAPVPSEHQLCDEDDRIEGGVGGLDGGGGMGDGVHVFSGGGTGNGGG